MSNLEVNSHVARFANPTVRSGVGWQAEPSPVLPPGITASELQQKQGKIQMQLCSLEATRDFIAIGDSHTGLESLGRTPDLSEPGTHVRQRSLSGLPEKVHGQGLAQCRALLQVQ